MTRSISAITPTINVIDPLSRIKGVGQVDAVRPARIIRCASGSTRNRLTELNLTPNDVITAVQGQNIQAALGRIGAAPVSTEQQFQLTIKTKGRLARPEEFANIILRANPDGSRRAGQGRGPRRDGRAIAGPLQPLQRRAGGGASASTSRRAPTPSMSRSRCARPWTTLATRFPTDLAYNVFFDTTVFVNATIGEVVRTLVIAIVLVAIVVFLFLGKLRTTLIPLVAVPVSIIGTFAVLLVVGYSANTVSLLALVLAIGIVVDDAIVVVENIERVIEEEPELIDPGRVQEGDGRDHRSDHRHHAGAAVGLRSGRLHLPASAGSSFASSRSRCRSRC